MKKKTTKKITKKSKKKVKNIKKYKAFLKKLGRKKILIIVFSIIFLIFLYFTILKDLPSPTKIGSPTSPASTQILDKNGKLLYEIYIEKNRVPVSLEELPEYVKQSTIAIEDKNFYKHGGFALEGIARAISKITFKGQVEGGSTITQQLVKNALLSPERTIRRKIREVILAIATEAIYSKDEILQMYLNQVPYGGTAYGIEVASQTYFNKHAKDLTLSEAALLAGLPAAPTHYSPFGTNPEAAGERQKLVLLRMEEEGFINEEQRQEAEKEELVFAEKKIGIKAPHFVLWVKELLVEQFGQRMMDEGGLKVKTTLDLDIQEFAQDAVATEVAKLEKRKLNIHNGASLVTNPDTGEILAMVGSHDYFDDEFDGKVNVTMASRQPGSSIKPINYAIALDKHEITAATVLVDNPTCFQVIGQPLYCPVNYDGLFHGPVQVRFALGNSFNIPAVKVLALNGLEDFVASASAMGLETFEDPDNYGLSLTLGGGEVKMTDMAVAFSSLANLGIRQDLYAIQRVEDRSGKILFEKQETEGPRVLSMEAAYITSHILIDNGARSAAFGSSSYLVVNDHPEISVKTGTTNDKRDNWTIGYTPSILVAVWVGNNDNSAMSYVASGVTGASPIWNRIIGFALKDGKQEWPIKPEKVVGAHVCSLSGKMPNPESPCQTRFEYFIEGTVPNEPETLKNFVEVNKETNQLATSKTPDDLKEMQEKTIIFDPLWMPFCLDCQVQTEAQIVKYPLPN